MERFPSLIKLVLIHHFNGNIVMIPKSVFQKLGNFDYFFTHGKRDFDYGLRTGKAGFEMFQIGTFFRRM